jgi:hypothetical protein
MSNKSTCKGGKNKKAEGFMIYDFSLRIADLGFWVGCRDGKVLAGSHPLLVTCIS